MIKRPTFEEMRDVAKDVVSLYSEILCNSTFNKAGSLEYYHWQAELGLKYEVV